MATEEQVQAIVREIIEKELPTVRTIIGLFGDLMPATQRWLITRLLHDLRQRHNDGEEGVT